MKFLGLALLLVLVQPLPPLPREAANKQTEKADQKPTVAKESNRAADKTDPAGESAARNATTYNTYNYASEAHPESAKQPESWSRADILTGVYDGLTGPVGDRSRWYRLGDRDTDHSDSQSCRCRES
jgi:hypothetical protein